MSDSTMQMTPFEERLAQQLRSASSVALRSVNAVEVARDAHASHVGGGMSLPSWHLLPQGLLRIVVIATLVLLLALTLLILVFGGPSRPQFVLPAPSNSPVPLESLPRPEPKASAFPTQLPPATPSSTPEQTPGDSPIPIPTGVGTPTSAAYIRSHIEGLAGSAAIATGDFNADGKIDMAVNAAPDQSVAILLGRGDGWFDFGLTQYFDATASATMQTGDIDRDGILDLVIGGENTIVVLRGLGDGTFEPPATYNLAQNSDQATVNRLFLADIDEDGFLDVVAGIVHTYGPGGSGLAQGQFDIFLSDGAGGFIRVDSHNCKTCIGVVAGDFDEDGHVDVATTDSSRLLAEDSGTLELWSGLGDGTFARTQTSTIGTAVAGTHAIDLNDDGHLDILGGHWTEEAVDVLAGNGDGTFTDALVSSTADPISGGYAAMREFGVGDFTGDGRIDLVANVIGSSNWSQAVLVGDGTGMFMFGSEIEHDQFDVAFAGADFDGDGALDVAMADGLGGVSVLATHR
jgi:hypothetical protein